MDVGRNRTLLATGEPCSKLLHVKELAATVTDCQEQIASNFVEQCGATGPIVGHLDCGLPVGKALLTAMLGN